MSVKKLHLFSLKEYHHSHRQTDIKSLSQNQILTLLKRFFPSADSSLVYPPLRFSREFSKVFITTT